MLTAQLKVLERAVKASRPRSLLYTTTAGDNTFMSVYDSARDGGRRGCYVYIYRFSKLHQGMKPLCIASVLPLLKYRVLFTVVKWFIKAKHFFWKMIIQKVYNIVVPFVKSFKIYVSTNIKLEYVTNSLTVSLTHSLI